MSEKELPVSESFLITCFGLFGGFLGGILTCILRSRCVRIKCWGIECIRELPDTTPEPIELTAVNVN